MSELAGILANAADNTARTVTITPNSQAVLFFALEYIRRLSAWRDYQGEVIPDADRHQITDLIDKAIDDLMREASMFYAGMYMDYAGVLPIPSSLSDLGWLVCDGSVIERATFPDLFAVIGTLYNVGGEASTHFRIPNSDGVSRMGSGTTVGLASTIGEATHILDITEMPNHSHPITDPGHSHLVYRQGGAGGVGFTQQANGVLGAVPTNAVTTGITVLAQGLSAAHNNIHPVIGCNVLIMSRNPTT